MPGKTDNPVSGAWQFASWLGVGASSLSLVMLVKQGWQLGFIAPLQTMLDYYHRGIEFSLGWADPYLKSGLASLDNLLVLHLSLYQHWKYIFVLVWLYFGADAKSNWSHSKNRSYALFSVVLGSIIALIVSVAVGTMPLDDATTAVLSVSYPVIGLIIFEFGRSAYTASLAISITSLVTDGKTWWQKFRWGIFNYVLPISALGIVAVAFAWWLERVQSPGPLSNPVLLPLAILVITINIFWLARAAWLATYNRAAGERWANRFLRSGSSSIGILMLSAMMGALLFIVLNAGLELAGL